jgi:hypothetical protein
VSETQMTSTPATLFQIDKGEVEGRRGWIVSHTDSVSLSGDYPFSTKRLANTFASRLPGLTTADGTRFDWNAPGVNERLATGYGQDGGSLWGELRRLQNAVELEAIDARKSQPSGAQSPFGSVTELRHHLEQLAAQYCGDDEGKAWRLTRLAGDPTLGLGPGGQLLYWREGSRFWVIAASWTAQPVAQDEIEDKRQAYEVAAWLETHVTDADGAPFPFGAVDIARRASTWRSVRGASLEEEVLLARGDFDRFRGLARTWTIDRAERIMREIATREAIAKRAAAGGYVAEYHPVDLEMLDEIEFDLTVGEDDLHRLAGDGAVAVGETVTLSGAISAPVSRIARGIGLAFEPEGLNWSHHDGRSGTVTGVTWWFPAYTSDKTVIYRRRAPEIDALTPEAWQSTQAEALAAAVGMSADAIRWLRDAVDLARLDDFNGRVFTRKARDAAGEVRGACPVALDRRVMQLLGYFDEACAWDRLGALLGDLPAAARLVAVAAERRRRRLGRPNCDYWNGREHAERIHRSEHVDIASLQAIPRRTLRGALDYAQARLEANTRWPAHVRTNAIDADGERWRGTVAAISGEGE